MAAASARAEYRCSFDYFIHAGHLTEQRDLPATLGTPSPAMVSGELTNLRKSSLIVVLGSFAAAVGFRTPFVRNGTEIRYSLRTSAGELSLCSRYAWEMSDHEVALFLRAAMKRHGAIE